MIHFVLNLFLISARNRYPKKILIFLDLFVTILDFTFYYFTSQAFGNYFGETLKNQRYFHFVLFGEIAIAIPLAALYGSTRTLKSSLTDGTFEILLTNSRSFSRILFELSVGDLVVAVIRVFILGGLGIIMGLNLSLELIGKLITLTLISFPFFWCLGLVGCVSFFFFGRGLGIFQQLGHLIALLAGVFFPITVFPSWLMEISRSLSPFTQIVTCVRSEENILSTILTFFILSIVSVYLIPRLFDYSLNFAKRSGVRLVAEI